MTFISVVETFSAVVVALGGLELIKWAKRTWFPKKTEQRLDESEAGKSEVEVQQAVQDLKDSINQTWQKNIKEFTEIDTARIKELRESNTTLNKQNTELNNQISELYKENARVNDLVKDKVQKIRELEESRLEDTKRYEQDITNLTKRNGELEKLVMFYRTWHCEREYGNRKEDCKRRKPAQNPPLRYCPIEERVVSGTQVSLTEGNITEMHLHPKEFEQ